MALSLALVGLLLAAAACVLAWRARRSSHNLAREMIELRDRLAGAERGHLAAEERAAEAAEVDASLERTVESSFDPELVQRLTSVEGQVRHLARGRTARVDPGPEPGPESAPEPQSEDPRAVVRRHLEHRGFDSVSFLGRPRDGRHLVELERGGIVTKGHAEIAPDGSVRLHAISSLRAFP